MGPCRPWSPPASRRPSDAPPSLTLQSHPPHPHIRAARADDTAPGEPTDRTYYNPRGFDITNFQVDGIGLPLIWGIQFGDLDTVLFERVQAVRGASLARSTGQGA